jgi:hypothetical protein
MEQIMRSNVQIYTMLRAIHESIPRSPAHQWADSIHFEDVLGRTKFLPYEYFRHVEARISYSKVLHKAEQLDCYYEIPTYPSLSAPTLHIKDLRCDGRSHSIFLN